MFHFLEGQAVYIVGEVEKNLMNHPTDDGLDYKADKWGRHTTC